MISIQKIQEILLNYFKLVASFFVLFYLVGNVGLFLPQTSPLFKKLIPVTLLLSTFVLAIFHYPFQKKEGIVFLIIYILGFVVEVIGVNTGRIFGNYIYGESLGLKLFSTPLIIGINWLLLSYISMSVAEKAATSAVLQIVIASSIMLAYDLIIEQLASVLDMWTWTGDEVPIKNYFAWFVLALLFNYLLKLFAVDTRNKLAPVILISQLLFFVILLVTLKS